MFISLETPPRKAKGEKRDPMYFFWAWNHMLSERTLTFGATFAKQAFRQCDEAFQDHMLREFRRYCGDEGGCLKAFYELKQFS